MTRGASGPPDRLRVLVIAPTPFFGDRGCHVRIYEEISNLSSLGVESLVVTYAAGRDVPGIATVRAPRLIGMSPKPLGPSYNRPILDAALCVTALGAARRFQPHVLHAHLHEGIAIGSIVRWRAGVPLVADLQGSFTAELVDHGYLRRAPMVAALGRLERLLVGRPDRLLVSSVAGVRFLAEQGVPVPRIVSLPDGVDLDVFRPLPRDPALVARFQLAGRPVVVFL
jgi:glycosyltransferase involved in cell wall biosynthesis